MGGNACNMNALICALQYNGRDKNTSETSLNIETGKIDLLYFRVPFLLSFIQPSFQTFRTNLVHHQYTSLTLISISIAEFQTETACSW